MHEQTNVLCGKCPNLPMYLYNYRLIRAQKSQARASSAPETGRNARFSCFRAAPSPSVPAPAASAGTASAAGGGTQRFARSAGGMQAHLCVAFALLMTSSPLLGLICTSEKVARSALCKLYTMV